MSQENTTVSQKSRLTLLILYLFPPFNAWSVYCFYAGKIPYGLFRLVLLIIAGAFAESNGTISELILGLWGLLGLVDFFKIILGKYKDKQGNPISSWNPKKDEENHFDAIISFIKEFCEFEPKIFKDFEDSSVQTHSDKFWLPEKYTRCTLIGKNTLQYHYNAQGEILLAISGEKFLYFSAHIVQNEDGKKVNRICACGNDLQKHEKDIPLILKNGASVEFLDSFKTLSQSDENIGEILVSYFEKLGIRRKEAEIEKQEELKRVQEEEKQKQLQEKEDEERRIEEQKRREQEAAERKIAEEKAYLEEHPKIASILSDLDSL